MDVALIWAPLCVCRLIKKLEHTWKALVHDGVGSSHTGTKTEAPSIILNVFYWCAEQPPLVGHIDT